LLDQKIKETNPHLLVVTAHNPIEALILYYKYKIKTAFFFAHFPVGGDFRGCGEYTRKVSEWSADILTKNLNIEATSLFLDYLNTLGYEFSSLKDIFKVFDNFYNLIAFSKEFLIEKAQVHTQDIYLGSCITNHNLFEDNTSELFNRIEKRTLLDKRLIYCSLGSWADQIDSKKVKLIYDHILECMQDNRLESYTLIMVVGKLFNEYCNRQTRKIIICKWAQQLKILRYSSLAIIHGGMGSIKECIHLNVPMIISPLGIDQFENTKRVLHHGFGLELEIQNANINTTIKNILNLIRDKETRTRIEQMELLQKRDSVNNHWMEKLIPAN
jgi:hypothetical protein